MLPKAAFSCPVEKNYGIFPARFSVEFSLEESFMGSVMRNIFPSCETLLLHALGNAAERFSDMLFLQLLNVPGRNLPDRTLGNRPFVILAAEVMITSAAAPGRICWHHRPAAIPASQNIL